MIREELPVETVATDGNYLFRRLGVRWSVKVSSACLQRELRKRVRCNWESFRHFVPLHPIQNNMQPHMNTKEDNKAYMERKWSVWWKYGNNSCYRNL
jgi:hypothetical protein